MFLIYGFLAIFLTAPFLVLQIAPSFRWLIVCTVIVTIPMLNEVYYNFVIPPDQRHGGTGFGDAFARAADYLYSISLVIGLVSKTVILFMKRQGAPLSERIFMGHIGFSALFAVPAILTAFEYVADYRKHHHE